MRVRMLMLLGIFVIGLGFSLPGQAFGQDEDAPSYDLGKTGGDTEVPEEVEKNKGYAYQKKDFFLKQIQEEWHPGRMCTYCHITAVTDKNVRDSITLDCDNCHRTYREWSRKKPTPESVYKGKIELITDLHGIMNCRWCHNLTYKMGETNNILKEFHSLHKDSTCSECHEGNNMDSFKGGELEVGIKGIDLKNFRPSNKACFKCHGETIHIVHARQLQYLCPKCHGDWGIKYFRDNPEELNKDLGVLAESLQVKIAMEMNETLEKKKLEEKKAQDESFTLSSIVMKIVEFFRSLLGGLLGG